jgi:hypothetical protein
MFFFEKKNQKTFVCLVVLGVATLLPQAGYKLKVFLLLFFQKKKRFLSFR